MFPQSGPAMKQLFSSKFSSVNLVHVDPACLLYGHDMFVKLSELSGHAHAHNHTFLNFPRSLYREDICSVTMTECGARCEKAKVMITRTRVDDRQVIREKPPVFNKSKPEPSAAWRKICGRLNAMFVHYLVHKDVNYGKFDAIS